MLLQGKGDIQPAPSKGPPCNGGLVGPLHIAKLNSTSVTSTAIPASVLQQKLGRCPCPGAGSGEVDPLAALPVFKLSPSKLQHVRCVKIAYFPHKKTVTKKQISAAYGLKKSNLSLLSINSCSSLNLLYRTQDI